MSAGLPDAILSEYKEVFSMFDVDGDGTIDSSELENVLKDLGTPACGSELQELMSAVDVDGNGVIDFEEFCVMMATRGNSSTSGPPDVLSEMKAVFAALDKDGDGMISIEDLRMVVPTVRWGSDRPPTETDLALMLAVGGDDIDFAAFQDIVSRFSTLS
jgi:calmodulin